MWRRVQTPKKAILTHDFDHVIFRGRECYKILPIKYLTFPLIDYLGHGTFSGGKCLEFIRRIFVTLPAKTSHVIQS